jgi:hypothetical protein
MVELKKGQRGTSIPRVPYDQVSLVMEWVGEPVLVMGEM